MYQCKFIQQIACLKWFGLIFCYIFKLNHTPSYEKKNDRKCSRVPMNTGSNLRLFFFSSECHQRPMYGQSGKIAYFGTRVPNFSRIYLYISRFANSEILKWKILKIPIKSLPSPLKIRHTFCRTCARKTAFVCQDNSILLIYCSLQNSTKSNWKVLNFLHRKIDLIN